MARNRMTAVAEPADAPALDADLVAGVASWFVTTGRVAPGLTVDDDGRARSWWWPLPTASDRAMLASLVGDANDIAAHRAAADALAHEVDAQVRQALPGLDLVEPARGRRPTAEHWLRSLTASDPWLPATCPRRDIDGLGAAVTEWVRGALVGIGSVGLRVRIIEPDEGSASWGVEALVHDIDESSLVAPLALALSDTTPFPGEAEAIIATLGRAVRVAPELAPLLDDRDSSTIAIDDTTLVTLLTDRSAPLAEVGVSLLVPTWWTNRRRLGVRAKASTKDVAAVSGAAFGFDDIVRFTWEAALGDQRLTKADLVALQRAADAKKQVVQVRGQWVQLRPDDLAAIARLAGTTAIATVGDLARIELGLPVIELDDDLPVLGVHATGRLGELLTNTFHERAEAVTDPPGFTGTLRPYQARGVGWLRLLGQLGLGACLADDMGLGKTAQVIAAVLSDRGDGPTLVVCPTSVLGNWEREVARFAPELRTIVHHGTARAKSAKAIAKVATHHDIVLTSYGTLARDVELLSTITWARVVLDEAQQVKNPYTAQAKAVQQLHAPRRVAMTGTPVENRLTDLWAVMHAVNPGLLGSIGAFKERFAVPIERQHDDDAADRLRRLTAPFVLRRLKTDRSIIDDLPDKIEMVDHCALTKEQATLYQAVVDDLMASAQATDGIDRRGLVLAGIMKLKQVCNHPAHFLKDHSALHGRSGKLERVEAICDELFAAGDKALAFTQFAEWGELIVPYLQRRFDVPVRWLHGGTGRKGRDALVAEFQEHDGPALFVLSLKAGGTGLNLTAASHVIHLDRWWNPAVEDQATDRAFRIGQKRNVVVHKLVCTGTIEERIDAMIAAKRALAGRTVGTGETWITELSNDELRALLTYDASGEEA